MFSYTVYSWISYVAPGVRSRSVLDVSLKWKKKISCEERTKIYKKAVLRIRIRNIFASQIRIRIQESKYQQKTGKKKTFLLSKPKSELLKKTIKSNKKKKNNLKILLSKNNCKKNLFLYKHKFELLKNKEIVSLKILLRYYSH